MANLDIHDIARAARTYGVKRFFIVTPIPEQRELVERILNHWKVGFGAGFNPSRKEAFDLVETKNDLDEVIRAMRKNGGDLRLIATGAKLKEDMITHKALRQLIVQGSESYLILFGTGSGLVSEIIERADYRLEPIRGAEKYNHLSVRSAVSIALDRLLGRET